MKRVQSFLLALVFVTVLSVSVPAGHIESGAVPDPTPEPTPAAVMAEPEGVVWWIGLFNWLTYFVPFSR